MCIITVFIANVYKQLVKKKKKSSPTSYSRLSMKACRLTFMFRGHFCQENQIDVTFTHACKNLSCVLATQETNDYTVQDNAERVILYFNVNVSCKERGLIQNIVSHSQIYIVYSFFGLLNWGHLQHY